MVQNKTEKVQSVLAEEIQINKKETELELGNIVQKLETKLEESFKALSEKVVSFMVNSMVEIYEKLDRKNADKVYISHKIMAQKPNFYIFDFFSETTIRWRFILGQKIA